MSVSQHPLFIPCTNGPSARELHCSTAALQGPHSATIILFNNNSTLCLALEAFGPSLLNLKKHSDLGNSKGTFNRIENQNVPQRETAN